MLTSNPNRVTESITQADNPGGGRFRVWREADHPSADYLEIGPDSEVMALIWGTPGDVDPLVLLRNLAKLPRVSAVEYVDENKNGTVLYPDWK